MISPDIVAAWRMKMTSYKIIGISGTGTKIPRVTEIAFCYAGGLESASTRERGLAKKIQHSAEQGISKFPLQWSQTMSSLFPKISET